MNTYRGSCHCGAVRFEVDLDLTQSTYRYEHYFCKHCGVRAFGIGTETPIGKMYGVNLGCLDGISDEELSRLRITRIDGLHDKWQEAPEFDAHL